MHTNIYLSFEYRLPTKKHWLHLGRLADPGADQILCTLLGGDEAIEFIPESECFEPQGWPEDVCESSLSEDCFTIDDDAVESNLGDILENTRFCTKADAEQWIAAGDSRPLPSRNAVTDPEAFGQSCLSYEDFATLVECAVRYNSSSILQLQAFHAALKFLREFGCKCRAIYWFE